MIDLIIEQGTNDYIVIKEASTQLQQGYDTIESAELHRMMDGTGVKQFHWEKRKTSITGSGHIPDCLSSIDWAEPVYVNCVRALSIESASNAIVLPSFRTDAPVTGFAIVAGELVPTPVSVLVNTATLTVVSGATRYKVLYYPIIYGYGTKPSLGGDYHESEFSWTLEVEEI